jgi:hypothetical protein
MRRQKPRAARSSAIRRDAYCSPRNVSTPAKYPPSVMEACRVERAWRARGASHLERAVDVESTEWVATGTGVIQQVGEEAVLADVRLETGRVDDEVGADLVDALGALDASRDLVVAARRDALDRTDDRPVPAFAAAACELPLPQLARGRVRAGEGLVVAGTLVPPRASPAWSCRPAPTPPSAS